MTVVITRFPVSDFDNPQIWRASEDEWLACGLLSDYLPGPDDELVMAVVAPADARCIWSALPELEPRQAEGVARLQANEQSLGLVHAVSRHIVGEEVVTATIAPAVMQDGLNRLALRGINPDIVIPFGLAVGGKAGHIVKADFDGFDVLRGATFAVPDEAVFRDWLVGDAMLEEVATTEVNSQLWAASQTPLLNLREGMFAKREQIVWATAAQRKWIKRMTVALLAATFLLGIVTLAKYWSATEAENDRALSAAQKIDPSIQDIAQAEAQLARALQQKGLAQGRFVPLSAGLWRAVKATPNVSARELRYGPDGILVAVLAAPNADSINRALAAIQQDGYRVTATPRQDNSGATLVDLTMRMP